MSDYYIREVHIDFDPSKEDSVSRITAVRLDSSLDFTPEQIARNLRLGAFYHPTNLSSRRFPFSNLGQHDVIVKEKNGKLHFAVTSPEVGKALLDLPRF